jgi:hypothetical protein
LLWLDSDSWFYVLASDFGRTGAVDVSSETAFEDSMFICGGNTGGMDDVATEGTDVLDSGPGLEEGFVCVLKTEDGFVVGIGSVDPLLVLPQPVLRFSTAHEPQEEK